ncbi:hypothetical protein TcasGA2_TC034554 [Tribolium castaneum]|uniref:Uncharacterized protein n=1 Tax=Tribolium castaneum TaxID=7070 RepID=A0A139WMR6_TRICA|nr:hypothetical protein TcasGA2_TC034554 [Tribolium castaneum]
MRVNVRHCIKYKISKKNCCNGAINPSSSDTAWRGSSSKPGRSNKPISNTSPRFLSTSTTTPTVRFLPSAV